jgi:hypothetical protein
MRKSMSALVLSMVALPSAAHALANDPGPNPEQPRFDETTWPANGRIVLGGLFFDARVLVATVDGVAVQIREVDRLASGRTFVLDPAPAEGQTVRLVSNCAEGAGDCADLDLRWTATAPVPAVGETLDAPQVTAEFDLYDHGEYFPDGCGDSGQAALYLRLQNADAELGPFEWLTVTYGGHRLYDVRGDSRRSEYNLVEQPDDEACLEVFVENAAGARGPVERRCAPCRARADDNVPLSVPPLAPAWTRRDLDPAGCPLSPNAETAVEPEPELEPEPENIAKRADDQGTESPASTDDAEVSGCSARPSGAASAVWGLVALGALRRRRARPSRS